MSDQQPTEAQSNRDYAADDRASKCPTSCLVPDHERYDPIDGDRIGQWVYGDHSGPNPGWRLDGTDLVLDFERTENSGDLPGCWVLFREGRYDSVIDHFLDGAMQWIERSVPEATAAAADRAAER